MMSTSSICILITIAVYLIGMLLIGFYFTKKNNSTWYNVIDSSNGRYMIPFSFLSTFSSAVDCGLVYWYYINK